MNKANNLTQEYYPDILNTLSNLSNDEVFTPPEIVNSMLDLLPASIWSDKNIRFLDPVTKSGVFLREIAKRLIIGLEEEFPILENRLEHIFKNQLYGIAITELTSLLSRRSVYCSKFPNSKYSVVQTNSISGNIRYKKIDHKWIGDKCYYCGASKKEFNRANKLETHAYEFIHLKKNEEIFDMKFDVIIGNPPYQLSDGGAQASASPLYHKFVEQAIKLNPRYLSMIIPARWFSGGKGLDSFRENMLKDNRIRQIIDFPSSTECFPGVKIEGGVCYFLWDRDNSGDCYVKTIRSGIENTMSRQLLEKNLDVFIRYNELISIYRKVSMYNEKSFSDIVSPRKPFGLATNHPISNEKKSTDDLIVYANKKIGNISKSEITQNLFLANVDKIFISYAYGFGDTYPTQVINKPIIPNLNSVCTETYLVIGPFKNNEEAQNASSYISTKFFRTLLLIQKNTQHATKNVYKHVPIQDFSIKWTDELLYKKYNFSRVDIDFIDALVKPMDLGDDTYE